MHCAYSVGGYAYDYLYVKVSDSAGCSPVDAADTATLRTDFSLRSQRIARTKRKRNKNENKKKRQVLKELSI